MKAQIHPKWFADATVTCACGNVFTIGSTIPSISVEVCEQCHPFYTGQMKYLDTAGRVDAFRARQKGAQKTLSKTQRREQKRKQKIAREQDRPESLEELRKLSKSK